MMKKYLGKLPVAQRGFTLLELLFVAMIIGILSVIAIPNYQKYVLRAKITESFFITSEARNKIAEYYRYTGEFPQDNFAAGIPAADTIKGAYIESLSIEDGAIHLLFSKKEPKLAGKYLSIRPVVTKGESVVPLRFICGYQKISKTDKTDKKAKTTQKMQRIIGKNKTNIETNLTCH